MRSTHSHSVLARCFAPILASALVYARAAAGVHDSPFYYYEVPSGTGPYHLQTADFDADGDLDLACLCTGNPNVRIDLLDAAQGVHWEERSLQAAVGSSTYALELGDLEGDGDVDLVAFGSNGSVLLYNDGSANFSTTSGPADGYARDLALADIDADGDLDLLLARNAVTGGVASLTLYRNNGSGGFGFPQYILSAVNFAQSVAAGDVDGDGDADVVVAGTLLAGGRGFALLRNTGGTLAPETPFALPPGSAYVNIELADVDLVPGKEVVAVSVTNTIEVHADGGGVVSIPLGTAPRAIAASCADLDGDGDGDLIVGDGQAFTSRSIGIVINLGAAGWSGVQWVRAGNLPGATRALDVDGDGDLDLVSELLYGSALAVLTNPGGLAFPAFPTSPVAAGTMAGAAAADMDGDGRLDVVTAGSAVRVHRNLGAGLFATLSSVAPLDTDRVVLADVNGDGTIDVLATIATGHGNGVAVFPNLGGGMLGSEGLWPTGLDPSDIVAGDFDGDLDVDFVTPSPTQNTLSLRRNDGQGLFTTLSTTPTGAGTTPRRVAAADLDLDQDLDLVVGLDGTSVVRCYLNDGGGNFSASSSIPGRFPFRVADFDGALGPDVITSGGSVVQAFLNQGGASSFAAQPAVTLGTNVAQLAISDFDRDGRPDVLLQRSPELDLELLRNVSNGTFGEARHCVLGDITTELLPGDFDGDGWPDISASTTYYQTNALVCLLQRPLEAGQAFCFGDGSAGTCPCGNSVPLGTQRGCANSTGNGGSLAGVGFARVGGDSLHLRADGLPANPITVCMQFDASIAPGTALGDGLLCGAGNLRRIASRSAALGAVEYPAPGAPSISVRGQVQAGQTYAYQVYYRNAAAFCTPATFNVTSAVSIGWLP